MNCGWNQTKTPHLNLMMNSLQAYCFHLKNCCAKECSFLTNVMVKMNYSFAVPNMYLIVKVVNCCYSAGVEHFHSNGWDLACYTLAGHSAGYRCFVGCLALKELQHGCCSAHFLMAGCYGILAKYIPDPTLACCIQARYTIARFVLG
jgi:hypothetical protein